jgi:competence protein ComFB
MYVLKNLMEETVSRQLETLQEQLDVCTCAKCRLDILALALNSLPSHYVVTEKGELLAAIDQTLPQNQADVIAALTRASLTVRANPQHEPEVLPNE